jgi:hypothetical protein
MEMTVVPVGHVTCHHFFACVEEVHVPQEIEAITSCLRGVFKLFPYRYFPLEGTRKYIFQGYTLYEIDTARVQNDFTRLVGLTITLEIHKKIMNTC